MDDVLKDFIYDAFDIHEITEYEFHEMYGFTFVAKRGISFVEEHLSAAEIVPVGIIYEENGEFYFAALHDAIEIDEIVKNFVEKAI